MIRIERNYKLGHKLIISAIVTFLFSTMLFSILQTISYKIIRNYCSQSDVVSRNLKKKAESLQNYICNNNLSMSEISQIDQWIKKEDLTQVSIYRGNILLYNSKAAYRGISLKESMEYIQPWQNRHMIVFNDGTLIAVIEYWFEHRYRDYVTYANLLIFFIFFITIMILLIQRKVRYINVLEQEIKILKGGDLNYVITVRGNDELAFLAQEIDEMRKAFISREQYADRVRTASNELMIGISHDLRTPLTALIGYLDVLEGGDIPASEGTFLKKCKNRAYQIKFLINNLFEYFFLSTTTDEQIQLSICSVNEELDEIIREHIFLLNQSGFLVKNKSKLCTNKIEINRNMMQRVFDNLLSNTCKYADPSFPITLISVLNEHELIIEIHNYILDTLESLQRTGIGLKICEKILLEHNGRFIHLKNENVFKVQLIFPIL
ncbi:sensor histidine kinase [Clostridium tetani]|uniref:histidine kinase n=1 Tax=Clostridium tetani (strain Massachusetts / E88) TaxID=212717 RepID=Q893C2_CLOTE|nr:HAMP domain-containing sensor histidine kinase [Clostridium tetani]AAO36420.1 sensory transduction protein kinase [Clostridium tetani E88]KGI37620.1 histidine kinase [Clostridium tetani]KGI39547.1 histidine kinase [Clostridium tetani ATCC 9441]KGI45659.1 histidine kinase [Clostridium tetani]KHO31546.1 histidine kinase [Clostridium tetani]